MNAPSFTYDNKIITVTHDMALHITHCGINSQQQIDLQKVFSHSYADEYFLELMHIIFTKLISNVPDELNFKLYVYQIPSCMVPYKFTKDAFEILKPLIVHHEKFTYERYFAFWEDDDNKEEEEENKKNKESKPLKSPFSLSSSEDEEEEEEEEEKKEPNKKSMFDLSSDDEDEEEVKEL